MENPIKMDDFGVPPILGNPYIVYIHCMYDVFFFFCISSAVQSNFTCGLRTKSIQLYQSLPSSNCLLIQGRIYMWFPRAWPFKKNTHGPLATKITDLRQVNLVIFLPWIQPSRLGRLQLSQPNVAAKTWKTSVNFCPLFAGGFFQPTHSQMGLSENSVPLQPMVNDH